MGRRIQRAFECAYRDFIVVAGIDQHQAGFGNQVVPVLRLDIAACHQRRMHVRHAQGDDFALQAHFHPVKRHLGGMRFLVFQRRQSRIVAQKSQHRMHVVRQAGNRAVDAFGGEQQRAFDAMRFTTRQQRRLQLGKVGQFNKFIERSGQKILHGDQKG